MPENEVDHFQASTADSEMEGYRTITVDNRQVKTFPPQEQLHSIY
jgi:hypothetical protein